MTQDEDNELIKLAIIKALELFGILTKLSKSQNRIINAYIKSTGMLQSLSEIRSALVLISPK